MLQKAFYVNRFSGNLIRLTDHIFEDAFELLMVIINNATEITARLLYKRENQYDSFLDSLCVYSNVKGRSSPHYNHQPQKAILKEKKGSKLLLSPLLRNL